MGGMHRGWGGGVERVGRSGIVVIFVIIIL